jgi:hypothetical protein
MSAVQRPTWILAFGLALLSDSAQAVSCSDDSCRKNEVGDRSAPSEVLLPGLKSKGELPPELRKKEEPSPDRRDEIDWPGYEWRKRIATLPAIPLDQAVDVTKHVEASKTCTTPSS